MEGPTSQGNGAFTEKELRSRRDAAETRVSGGRLLTAGPGLWHGFQPPSEWAATATPTPRRCSWLSFSET